MRRWLSVVAVVVVACGTQMQGEASLTVTLSPSKITDATPVAVKVSAVGADGKVGTGTVRVNSARGSLSEGVDLTLDEYGTARTTLLCDPGLDPECLSSVRVTAAWLADGTNVSTDARLNVGVSGPAGGGAGGGGGSTVSVLNSCSDTVIAAKSFGAPLQCCVSMGFPACPSRVLRDGDEVSLRFRHANDGTVAVVTATAHVEPLAPCDSLDTAATPLVSLKVPDTAATGELYFHMVKGLVGATGVWEIKFGGGSDGATSPSAEHCRELVAQNGRAYFVALSEPRAGLWNYEPSPGDPSSFVMFLYR